MSDLDLDLLERLEAGATPGPWRECGHDRGGCQCAQVWSVTRDQQVLRPGQERAIGNTFATCEAEVAGLALEEALRAT
jgi:hypothetical protein